MRTNVEMDAQKHGNRYDFLLYSVCKKVLLLDMAQKSKEREG